MIGHCPKCNVAITTVDVNGIEGSVMFGKTWKTVTYNCRGCHAVLGVQIDPIAVKNDIVNEVVAGLTAQLSR